MRVLFVTTAYPRYKADIITPWLVELIQRLRARGIAVSVFTSSYMGLKSHLLEGVQVFRFRYFFKPLERLTHEETAVHRLGRSPLNLFLSILYIISGSLAIHRLTRAIRYDIVHIHWPFPHIIFGIVAKYFGRIRLFATFYGLEIRWLKKRFKFLIKPFSLLVNRADVITAISNHTAGELKGIVKKELSVIPFSTAVYEKAGEISDQKEIIFVGRHVQRKGVDILITAFNEIKNQIPHRLVIVGDGPERPRWQALAQRLDQSGRIQFTGTIPDKAKNDLYRRCSFLVLPAVYDRYGDTEGLGVVLIEAMSYSKPAIASNTGGITDIIVHGENGLLVPPGKPELLANAIKELALHPDLCRAMGEKAKKIVDERFNWDKITKRLISLYESSG